MGCCAIEFEGTSQNNSWSETSLESSMIGTRSEETQDRDYLKYLLVKDGSCWKFESLVSCPQYVCYLVMIHIHTNCDIRRPGASVCGYLSCYNLSSAYTFPSANP
ncbi:hypothetical protein TNCV_4858931 [Trichonephila clavipes]|nr:hypothetical protein TNCV_4858931 [Trichonephila clavipes]